MKLKIWSFAVGSVVLCTISTYTMQQRKKQSLQPSRAAITRVKKHQQVRSPKTTTHKLPVKKRQNMSLQSVQKNYQSKTPAQKPVKPTHISLKSKGLPHDLSVAEGKALADNYFAQYQNQQREALLRRYKELSRERIDYLNRLVKHITTSLQDAVHARAIQAKIFNVAAIERALYLKGWKLNDEVKDAMKGNFEHLMDDLAFVRVQKKLRAIHEYVVQHQ